MWLTIASGPGAGETVQLAGEQAVVGREEDCDLVIEGEKVSRRHAAFERLPDGRWQVTDLGSTNGTFVNGERLAANAPRALSGGERIRIGDAELVVSATEPGNAPPTVVAGAPPTRIAGTPAGEPEQRPAAERGFLAGPGRWVLVGIVAAALVGGGTAAGLVLSGGDDGPPPLQPAALTGAVTVFVTTAVTEPPPETAVADTGAAATEPVADTGAASSGDVVPTEAEAALLDHMPEEILGTCFRPDASVLEMDGVITAVACDLPDGSVAVYWQFDGTESMTAWYENRTVSFGATSDEGDCATDPVAEGQLFRDDEPAGRVVCGRYDDEYRGIAWTNDQLAIGALALGTDQQSLYDSWTQAGPV
jgi:hypothetical protein